MQGGKSFLRSAGPGKLAADMTLYCEHAIVLDVLGWVCPDFISLVEMGKVEPRYQRFKGFQWNISTLPKKAKTGVWNTLIGYMRPDLILNGTS